MYSSLLTSGSSVPYLYPHTTTIYLSSYCYMHMCPHTTTTYVSSYCYELLHVCAHTATYLLPASIDGVLSQRDCLYKDTATSRFLFSYFLKEASKIPASSQHRRGSLSATHPAEAKCRGLAPPRRAHGPNPQACPGPRGPAPPPATQRSASGVSMCTFILVKQVLFC